MSTTQPKTTIYWRPGCMFCSRLRSGLGKYDLDAEWINIWDDPNGAKQVRKIANGNETVPTVVVGDHFFVNPSAAEVAEAAGVASSKKGWFK